MTKYNIYISRDCANRPITQKSAYIFVVREYNNLRQKPIKRLHTRFVSAVAVFATNVTSISDPKTWVRSEITSLAVPSAPSSVSGKRERSSLGHRFGYLAADKHTPVVSVHQDDRMVQSISHSVDLYASKDRRRSKLYEGIPPKRRSTDHLNSRPLCIPLTLTV